MNLCFPTTADLAKRLELEGPQAYETMTAGQILRVEYAIILRHLAQTLRADAVQTPAPMIDHTGTIGAPLFVRSAIGSTLDLYATLESALEQRVNALVQREVYQRTHEAEDRERAAFERADDLAKLIRAIMAEFRGTSEGFQNALDAAAAAVGWEG
jgi:hypothetical protein